MGRQRGRPHGPGPAGGPPDRVPQPRPPRPRLTGSWPEARRLLEDAELYWLATVRADGRPHVTPLIGVSPRTPMAR
ncbi:pyridoxamine 5'-phosphate oxidase family protein [Actinomadura sp. WMMB 499]|uniref:pyridoxamine 5'-phosphate oxidase family protein n=1 Tax=Actinomadura sp. WMMB 499 TaxID=1219491 RepID=UPI0012474EE0|nr:pyridoxamine 5'-phosphate oxidase family protein [Actinomadura sp. WMMB 499]QFG25164.1 pyridoxamine 5'-phosphate oxidase family protein [Actinomadura sp. WMMB 499]